MSDTLVATSPLEQTLVSVLADLDPCKIRTITFDGLVVETAEVIRTKTIPCEYPSPATAESPKTASALKASDPQLYARARNIVVEGVDSYQHRLS
jgi:hypothetical protein